MTSLRRPIVTGFILLLLLTSMIILVVAGLLDPIHPGAEARRECRRFGYVTTMVIDGFDYCYRIDDGKGNLIPLYYLQGIERIKDEVGSKSFDEMVIEVSPNGTLHGDSPAELEWIDRFKRGD